MWKIGEWIGGCDSRRWYRELNEEGPDVLDVPVDDHEFWFVTALDVALEYPDSRSFDFFLLTRTSLSRLDLISMSEFYLPLLAY